MFHELALSLCWAFINIRNCYCMAPSEQTRLLLQLSNVFSSRTFEDNSRKGRNTKTWRPCLRRPCPSLWGCAMSGLRWHLKQETKKGFLKLFWDTAVVSTAVEHMPAEQNSWGRGFDSLRVVLAFLLSFYPSGVCPRSGLWGSVTIQIFLKKEIWL